MKTIIINASKKYNVYIGADILDSLGEKINELPAKKYKKVAVISDSNVFPLYGKTAIDSLKKSGYQTFNYVFEAGESAKSFKNLEAIISWLCENSFTRSDLIVALGGGVCGDLSGFVSSIFLRGIDYVQVPTTFLAAIDSSVGGKTAVNIPEGKNLVGSFWQPSLVLCDTNTLKTLPYEVFTDGVAEAIKYGCIWDKELFDTLSNDEWTKNNISAVIARCVEIKADVVAEDELDTGIRQILNFGHTLGHAIEKLSQLKISHGHAVGIGMYLMTVASEKNGLTEKGASDKIKNALNAYSLPYAVDYSLEDLSHACVGDKKSSADNINIITIKNIGSYEINSVKIDSLYAFFKGEQIGK